MKKILFICLFLFSNFSYPSASYWNTPEEALSSCQNLAGILNTSCNIYTAHPDNQCTDFIASYQGYATYFYAQSSLFKVRCGEFYEQCSLNGGAVLDGYCVLPPTFGCYNSYNDLDPLKPGVQCASQKSAGQSNCTTQPNKNGNPCDASTGNKFQTEVDYSSNSLSFVRYYNSLYPTQSFLGKQWTHDYLASLTIADTVKVNRPDGKVLEFHNDVGIWTSDADITETLTSVGTTWEYKTSNDSIETYNEVGQLLSITARDGKVTSYAYNTNGLLEQVTGPYGRTLGFIYDDSNRLITLTTPENTEIHYAYDNATQNLVSVTYPDNTSKTYHYENSVFPNHLTGITDENGVRYATWAYNDGGLAILSEHANGAESVTLAYNTDETTTVTNALGRVKTYTFEAHYGLRKPKTIDYTFNDGQQASTKSKTYIYYPENGWVKEVTDYNGNVTYYEYNARGLITLETQAKGTAEEYTVTTTWHPDFRLPSSSTYPDRTETYSYDTKGLLINTQISSNP